MCGLQIGRFSARSLGCAALGMLLSCWSVVPAQAGGGVLTDDFSGVWDYSGGTVDPGTIWDGTHNMGNLSGGLYGSNFFGNGELYVDDNNVTNVGWEGGRSTAPLLFTDVAPGQDFAATVKITSQTSGFWSAAGLIARAKQGTPPGTDADHADEHFVTATSFRTNADIPDVGTTLNKRIEDGAQLNDIQVNVDVQSVMNPNYDPNDPNSAEFIDVSLNPVPFWIRLERVGGVGYRTSVSSNGTDFQLQSHTIPTAGSPLRDSSIATEVGLGYMNFGGSVGSATFDDFVLDTHDPLPSPGAPDLPDTDISLQSGPNSPNISQVIEDATMQGILEWTRTAPEGQGNLGSTFGPGGLFVNNGEDGLSATFNWDSTGTAPGTYHWDITATNDWGDSDSVSLWVTVVPEPASLALAGLAVLSAAGYLARRRRV